MKKIFSVFVASVVIGFLFLQIAVPVFAVTGYREYLGTDPVGPSASTQSAPTRSSALLGPSTTVSDLIASVLNILRGLVPLLVGAAVIVFLYGVLHFIVKSSAGNAEGRKEGINFMIFGIIGIAVMVSVWGLVMFVTNTFGVTNVVPQFNSNLSQ